MHLHDNDGIEDRHWLPFTGSVDWRRLAGIMARSAYGNCVSLESTVYNAPESRRDGFLAEALTAGQRLAEMIRLGRRDHT